MYRIQIHITDRLIYHLPEILKYYKHTFIHTYIHTYIYIHAILHTYKTWTFVKNNFLWLWNFPDGIFKFKFEDRNRWLERGSRSRDNEGTKSGIIVVGGEAIGTKVNESENICKAKRTDTMKYDPNRIRHWSSWRCKNVLFCVLFSRY